MLPMADQGKVFQDALIRINDIILEDELVAGDRLPSERELSERLKIGRSSIREALRALELLGLITTRRGEGTFISESPSHHFVEIMASFILRTEQSKRDLLEMRSLIEVEAAKLAADRRTETTLNELGQCLRSIKSSIDDKGILPLKEELDFHRIIVKGTANSLMLRVWEPLIQFTSSRFMGAGRLKDIQQVYRGMATIYEAIQDKDSEAAAVAMKEQLQYDDF